MPEEETVTIPEEEKITKDTNRFHELNVKTDRTEQEETEFTTIKSNYGKNVQTKFDDYKSKVRDAGTKLDVVNEELVRLREENDNLKTKDPEKSAPVVSKDQVKVGEQMFDTDETLQSKVTAGQMTNQQAWDYSNTRKDAEIDIKINKGVASRFEQEQVDRAKTSDIDNFSKRNPTYLPKLADGRLNPDHNPNDERLKLIGQIYNDGYKSNPDGLRKAEEIADRILGTTKVNPDLSAELGVITPSAPVETKEKLIEMDEDAKDRAFKMYRDINNPITGRNYTEKESHEKYKKALADRAGSRRIT